MEWCRDTASGTNDCAMKLLSKSFGNEREPCGACRYCELATAQQLAVERRVASERKNGQLTEEVLRTLADHCVSCCRCNCPGIPFLAGQGSKQHPANRSCCFAWHNCYRCGVSNHARDKCFNKTYLYHIACAECWVFKGVPGWVHHNVNECPVKGRLRRLLSFNYINNKEKVSFEVYILRQRTWP